MMLFTKVDYSYILSFIVKVNSDEISSIMMLFLEHWWGRGYMEWDMGNTQTW